MHPAPGSSRLVHARRRTARLRVYLVNLREPEPAAADLEVGAPSAWAAVQRGAALMGVPPDHCFAVPA